MKMTLRNGFGRMLLFAYFALGMGPGNSFAQSTRVVAFTSGFEPTFNLQDIFFGLNAGIESPKLNGSFTAGFSFRLGSKKVLIQEAENFYYQFRERRYVLWTGFEKRVKFIEFDEDHSLNAFGFLRGGFSFGDYRGTDRKPDSGFLFLPGAGLAYRTTFAIIKGGYQYVPLKTESISPHRIFLGVNFVIGEE